MLLTAKAWLQRAWVVKSDHEQREIKIKVVLFIITLVTSLYNFVLGIDLSSIWRVALNYILPVFMTAINTNLVQLIFAGITGILSAYLFISSLRLTLTKNLDWVDQPIERPWNITLRQDYIDSGYIVRDFGTEGRLGCASYSPKVNQAISKLASMPYVLDKKPWTLRGIGKELLPFALYRASTKGIVFDADKIRLNTDILLQDGRLPASLTLNKTTYFNGLSTNDQSFRKVYRRRESDLKSHLTPIYDGISLFLEAIGEGAQLTALTSLSGSRCSNHLGVSTMAITNDGVVIITGQSSRNLQSRRLLAPSGSGSMDWRDLGKDSDLLVAIKRAAERELAEECGIKPSMNLMSTSVIGFARMVHRGGKPDFFCITKINLNSGDLELSHEDMEKTFTAFNHSDQLYRKIDVTPGKVRESVKTFCEEYQNQISLPLVLNLEFMAQSISAPITSPS